MFHEVLPLYEIDNDILYIVVYYDCLMIHDIVYVCTLLLH